MTPDELAAVLPVLLLLVGGAAVSILGRTLAIESRVASLLGVTIALASFVATALAGGGHDAFNAALRRDSAAVSFSALATSATGACAALGMARRSRPAGTSSVARMLVSCAGAVIVVSSGDLVALFVGIALMSLPLALEDLRGRAGILSIASLGLAGAGVADVIVATGSSSLSSLALATTPLALVGVALVLAALVLDAGLVPFHRVDVASSRTRDAGLAAYLLVVTRIAGIGGLLRVGAALADQRDVLDWRASIAVIAAVCIVVSSVVALGQASVRRIVVYATSAHAGYVAVALAAGVAAGPAAAFYLLAFGVMTIGILAILGAGADVRLSELRGFARRQPLSAIALAVLLLSLAGLPPTAGFVAKMYVIELAVGAQLAWLAILAAIAGVLSAVYYLRILFACLGEGEGPPIRPGNAALALVAAGFALVIGVMPGPLLDAVANVRF